MEKKFGVKMTLPEHDPMRRANLLGDDFAAERWFATEEERQAFLESYRGDFIYYRIGDRPRYEYELINR